jgi:hypothetical protein
MNCVRSAMGFLTIVISAVGGTITINSTAANTTNDTALPTIEIAKHAAWADPFEGSAWLSTRNSGDSTQANFFRFDNGTTVTFSHLFDLPAVASNGSLSVRADDTASVRLNGVLLFAGSNTPGDACSATPIGCLVSTTGVLAFSDLQAHLVPGGNVLSFAVRQSNGEAFGLTYSGSITYRESDDFSTPEPSSYLLSATGLMIGALVWRRVRGRASRDA